MKYDAENYTWSQEQCTHDEYWQHSRKGEEWGDKLW
jgi:hypothetical protein